MTKRVVGSARIAGMVQLHQAAPLVERQHALIEEMRLNWPDYTSANRLSQRVGVSTRTIERDMERLQNALLPIERRRGRHGGYRLQSRAPIDAIRLNPSETAAIVASLVSLGPFSSASAASALDKLTKALCGPSPSSTGPASH